MTILGIETSCDETAAAVIEDGVKIVSNVKATSFISKKFGGVVPDKTAREQLKFILPVIQEALVKPVDAIAVTVGPGLIGSLLIGVETAKTLALAWNKPLIPINHLLGHIYANWLDNPTPPEFPALILLVSGGHSEIVLMKGHGQFKLVGSTRDDAAGECFDKCGRLLGLPYPYGPYVETLAAKADSKTKISLPRPLIHERNFDFSFSGLKTAFLREFQKGQDKVALAFELQEAVTEVLVTKFLRAAEKFSVRSLVLAGGVAANLRLRDRLSKNLRHVFIPPLSLCTDNAAYIASCAFFNYYPRSITKISADPSLDV